MITVDGREPGWSIGMTLDRFAQEFLRQTPPAYYAFNMDGGGATEMWVAARSGSYCQMHPPAGGCTVDRPSDGHERAAITSLQVLSGSDPGEPSLSPAALSAGAASTPSPVNLAAWASLVAGDGGSTGGLSVALGQGELGRALPRRVLRSILGSVGWTGADKGP